MGGNDIVSNFGNRLRIRVNGICVQDQKILLVKHQSIGPAGFFWSPPGGGMEFGSSASENLEREFQEETGLKVKVEELLFVHEFLNVPLHAIELFFSVVIVHGNLTVGYDPELSHEQQIITELKWMNIAEVKGIDKINRHQVFDLCEQLDDLFNLKGYFKL
jgi:8-oxo-dGTP diphosphatase